MGLCKCPKKQVTHLFCYEHRVNVCQNCMVKHHSKCIVKTYLQWLQDDDYNPNCVLCGDKLDSKDCVRLLCLHIFHWKCLDRKCRRLPSTTAPAGYSCPLCDDAIFPIPNVVTPVAIQLRDKLSTVNWARRALGLPAVSDNDYVQSDDTIADLSSQEPNCIEEIDPNNTNNKVKKHLVLYLDEAVYSRPEEKAKLPRRIMSNLASSKMLLADEDEKKKRQRYPLSWLSRWFKFFGSRMRFLVRREPLGKCRLIILGIIIIAMLCTVLSILGRTVTENDPAFDPVNNPHVHLKEGTS